jgi:hypothetical protein
MANIMIFYTDLSPQNVIEEWDIIKNKYMDEGIYDINFIEYNCTIETDETKELIEKHRINEFTGIYGINNYPIIIITINDAIYMKIMDITFERITINDVIHYKIMVITLEAIDIYLEGVKLPLINNKPVMK